MNITQEKTGDLTALVKVEISEQDYINEVNTVLKDYQKKANMPGFRPGKVPFGLVKKMYGKSVLAEEVNKVLTDAINKYLVENEIKILGHPLPNKEKSPEQNFEVNKDFEFFFDIGLAPEVEQEINDKLKVDYYLIEPDDKFLNEYIEDIRKRVGEADKSGPAEVNEELFKKVFPHDDIKTEEDFKKRISEEAKVNFMKESDHLFMNDTIEKLIDEAKLALPDEFLKRWLLESNEGKITEDKIDEEYDQYSKALKWQLIQNKIITAHNIEVKQEEIKDYIKDYLEHQLHIHDDGDEAQDRLNSIVESVMQNKEEVSKIYDQLLDQKMKELLKNTLKLRNKKVSYDDFIKLVKEKNKK
jgi:FKBP-type peptidyl-prolyl cis-trans isomerase (trigger factor)